MGERRPSFICKEDGMVRNAKFLLQALDQFDHLSDVIGSQSIGSS
uniref:Uncharacterized protein n=1 Tax=viral metagenome TaxID=1070528 RepID=A0A6C0IX96_9ZZZZ